MPFHSTKNLGTPGIAWTCLGVSGQPSDLVYGNVLEHWYYDITILYMYSTVCK